jgi:hypothetical protein
MSRRASATSSKSRRKGQVPVQVWVPEDEHARFKELVKRDERSIAGALRLHIAQRVAEDGERAA